MDFNRQRDDDDEVSITPMNFLKKRQLKERKPVNPRETVRCGDTRIRQTYILVNAKERIFNENNGFCSSNSVIEILNSEPSELDCLTGILINLTRGVIALAL